MRWLPPGKKVGSEKAAKAKSKPFFSLIVADFFTVPVIDEIDLSNYNSATGNPIVVRAHDDFEGETPVGSGSDINSAETESGEAVENPPISGR